MYKKQILRGKGINIQYDTSAAKKNKLSVYEESIVVSNYFCECKVCFVIATIQSCLTKKYVICSKKRESRERDNKIEKQWTGMETESKTIDNDVTKKNGEERPLSTSTTSSVDESLPKVNPVKWTVIKFIFHSLYTHVTEQKES